jgi:hypothetical protein
MSFFVHVMKRCGKMELWVEVNGQHHLSAALPTEKEAAVQTDGEIFWGSRTVLGISGVQKYF